MSLTIVTANMIDQDGTPWRRGTWKLTFFPNPDRPDASMYNIGGVALDPSITSQSGTLDDTNNAAFNFVVYDNSSIVPAGSQWRLTVCPLASAECGIYTFSAAGPTINISNALTFLMPVPRFVGIAGTFGYNDTEVIPSNNPGSTYWNVIDRCQKFWDDSKSQWIFGTTSVLPYWSNLIALGDPINQNPSLDWNALKGGGFFFMDQPALNAPPDTDIRSYFLLILADKELYGGVVVQQAWNFNEPGYIWTRQYRADSNTWSPWVEYYTTVTGGAGGTGPGTQGPPGPAGTITIADTTTGAAGSAAAVTNSGGPSAAILHFIVPQGTTGAAGSQGNPGTPGATGSPGAPGAAATIAVGTVSTGAAGSQASVTNSGTSNAAVLNFSIPQGAQGTPGTGGSGGSPAGSQGQLQYNNASASAFGASNWAVDSTGYGLQIPAGSAATNTGWIGTTANNRINFGPIAGGSIATGTDLVISTGYRIFFMQQGYQCGTWNSSGLCIYIGNQSASASAVASNGAQLDLSNNGLAAATGAQRNSGQLNFTGNYWNGSASAQDYWTIQNVVPTGQNPQPRLTIGRSGSPSQAAIQIVLSAVPVYADNTSAITGGLSAGCLYRTGADPDVLCIVH